ncbi:MAG TPA: hypothetical protein VNV66_16810 [Pilimelia sp.]|nr:hypothetical protein [Pilimelia sp.]
MGTLGGSDSGNWPPDGGHGPDTPAGWGPLVVPDDPRALAAEAAEVRRELRARARRRRWRQRLRRLTGGPEHASVRGALVPVLGAPLVALASLAVLTWPVTAVQPGRDDPRGTGTAAHGTTRHAVPRTLPALDLIDGEGRAVPLRGLLPAVILVVERCACPHVVATTAAAAPAEVSVVVVARRTPTLRLPEPHHSRVRMLADPAGELSVSLGLDPPVGHTAAVLVDRGSALTRVVPAATGVAPYVADLARLPARP